MTRHLGTPALSRRSKDILLAMADAVAEVRVTPFQRSDEVLA